MSHVTTHAKVDHHWLRVRPGYTAAIYAARAMAGEPILIQGIQPGGQLDHHHRR